MLVGHNVGNIYVNSIIEYIEGLYVKCKEEGNERNNG